MWVRSLELVEEGSMTGAMLLQVQKAGKCDGRCDSNGQFFPSVLFSAAHVPSSCEASLVFFGSPAGAASGVDVSHENPGGAKNRKT